MFECETGETLGAVCICETDYFEKSECSLASPVSTY